MQQAAVIAYEQLSDLQKVILHGEAVLRELPSSKLFTSGPARGVLDARTANSTPVRRPWVLTETAILRDDYLPKGGSQCPTVFRSY